MPDTQSVEFIRHCVRKSIHAYDFRNALFLCERLISINKTTENFLLFGDCYLKAGKPKAAYLILKDAMREMKEENESPVAAKLRFLFALCCYKLKLYREAERSLIFGASVVRERGRQLPPLVQSAESLHLLGKINREENKIDKAIEFFKRALRKDPFIWTALEAICDLGGDVDVDSAYSHSKFRQDRCMMETNANVETFNQSLFKSSSTPENQQQANDISFLQSPGVSPNTESNQRTPTLHLSDSSIQHNLSISPSFTTPPSVVTQNVQLIHGAPMRNARAGPNPVETRNQHMNCDQDNTLFALRPTSRQQFSNSTNLKTSSSNRKKKLQTPHSVKQENSPQPSSLEELFTLLNIMGKSYSHLCKFECQEALESLSKIPHQQADTGWVSAMLGRCHFELHDYHRAEACFDQMRKRAKYRTETLDFYSTTLWHLKKEVKLSVLGQTSHDLDKMCPETWIIIGNCFALQKEHDQALRFFRRAIQVDQQCAYAYTLSAHEYAANEDFEKAIAAFRHAIRINQRHYNAWFGLGNIYHRQERYEMAAEHYEKAVKINQRSAVIHCFLGITYYSENNHDLALKELKTATKLTPTNPMARFHLGKVLMAMKRYEEALVELKEANTIDPHEVSVYFTLGELYKRINRHSEALSMYTQALDVDPKHKKMIKQALDSLVKEPNADTSDAF